MKNALSPIVPILSFLALLLGLMAAAMKIVEYGHSIPLDNNQVLYLFSTSAQVIAAVYGLTLTGFIFFRNELSREELEDDTLTDAVESLKSRYFWLLVFITILVTLTLILSNLAISYEGSGEFYLDATIINAGQSAFWTSLSAIAYFIFDVISPKRIEAASNALRKKADEKLGGQPQGPSQGQPEAQPQAQPQAQAHSPDNLQKFLKNYNEIEGLLKKSGPQYQVSAVPGYGNRPPRQFSNSRLANILLKQKQIDSPLFEKLLQLITIRNSTIHGTDPSVSDAIVAISADILQQLKTALDRDRGDEPQ